MSELYLPSYGGDTTFIFLPNYFILHLQLYLFPHRSIELAPRRVFLQELILVVGQAAQSHHSKY